MPSPATAPIHPAPDSAVDPVFYRTRDEFMRAYKPVTDEERLLVIQAARAWLHLQEVYDLRARLTAAKGLLGLFEEDFEKYKFLMRNLTEAERMWRNAIQEFQRARRRGPGHLGNTRLSSVSTIPSTRPVPVPASEPGPSPAVTPSAAAPSLAPVRAPSSA